MFDKNYYEILGLSRNATYEKIRQAYINLSKKYHPDINQTDPNAEEKMKLINEAYFILSNSIKRQDYNRFGFYQEIQT
ncbi:MAG: DnaJ domain-containing protein, partial [Thermodesulfobium sp.]